MLKRLLRRGILGLVTITAGYLVLLAYHLMVAFLLEQKRVSIEAVMANPPERGALRAGTARAHGLAVVGVGGFFVSSSLRSSAFQSIPRVCFINQLISSASRMRM